MTRPYMAAWVAILALLTTSYCGAEEIFSVTHNELITLRILDGKDGKPQINSHLVLFGGYDEGELQHRLWHEEALTDGQGMVRLSQKLSYLPYLQVWVNKTPLCLQKPRKASFSVELIRRDGLSTPNECGIATAKNTPGTLTVFVKVKDVAAKNKNATTNEDIGAKNRECSVSKSGWFQRLRPDWLFKGLSD